MTVKAFKTRDLQVTSGYDICFDVGLEGVGDIATTDPRGAHTLAQALYLCLGTKPGDFALRDNFGASPAIFVGRTMTPLFFTEIERYVTVRLEESGLLSEGFPFTVQAAPISQTMVVMRVKIFMKKGTDGIMNIDMLYDSSDNKVYPLSTYNGGHR